MPENKSQKSEQELILEHSKNVEALWSDQKLLAIELKRLLQNFGHRYFPDDFALNVIRHSDSLNASIVGQEYRLKEGIKHANADVKHGATLLAKNVSYSEKPCMRYTLDIKHRLINGETEVEIFSEISWDFPHFKDQSMKAKKCVQIRDKDTFTLRKKLSQALEEACSLF